MSDCLKAATPASQQEKMKACNKDATAKALKGDERKAFMITCLAGEKKSQRRPRAHPFRLNGQGETQTFGGGARHRWAPRFSFRASPRRPRDRGRHGVGGGRDADGLPQGEDGHCQAPEARGSDRDERRALAGP